MVLLYQLAIFLIIVLSSFFGIKALLCIASITILFTISNVFTFWLIGGQFITIAVATGIGVLIILIKNSIKCSKYASKRIKEDIASGLMTRRINDLLSFAIIIILIFTVFNFSKEFLFKKGIIKPIISYAYIKTPDSFLLGKEYSLSEYMPTKNSINNYYTDIYVSCDTFPSDIGNIPIEYRITDEEIIAIKDSKLIPKKEGKTVIEVIANGKVIKEKDIEVCTEEEYLHNKEIEERKNEEEQRAWERNQKLIEDAIYD